MTKKSRTGKKRKSGPSAAVPAPQPESFERTPIMVLGVVVLLAIVVFFPLTTYFFAQDDFGLMLKASSDTKDMLGNFFGPHPSQFRPLTKTFYFAAMYKTFGLNPTPFHVVSLLFHLLNTVLVYALLQRLRIGVVASLVATIFFALNVAFLNILVWISCIQQLMALCFMLLTVLWGFDAVRTGSQKRLIMSVVAYVLAVMSMEQAVAAPVVLFLFAYFNLDGGQKKIGAVRSVLSFWPHFAVLLVYAVFMLGWKGLPDSGPYKFAVGQNVLSNLSTYLGWMYDFFVVLPFNMSADGSVTVSHMIAFALVAYLLVRRRIRSALFGTIFFLVTILPAAFLSQHTFFLHTYIPAFGAMYLLAVVLDDILRWSPLANRTVGYSIVGVALVIVGITSFKKVRENEITMITRNPPIEQSFVIRRAKIAKRAYEDIMLKTHEPEKVSDFYMIYARKNAGAWNQLNVAAALGHGSAIKLFLEKPELNVNFISIGDSIPNLGETARFFIYNEIGNCYTIEEARQSGL